MHTFEIGVTDEFEAAHALTGDFGPATRLHGHTYKVEVRLTAGDIDATGTFFDLGRLRSELRGVLETLHYRNLNELPDFSGINTTAEALARYVARKLCGVIQEARLESLKVTVWESASSFASYKESFES